ncbi:hypothetical protein [Mariniplasma anaerobium]|uniref:Uncharacterized protein n=1 Tax=Mariniplasma anaerobium TaxID=2735436 RepID=A0A7U9TL76_9MOLU|nr:hypothetical protein [Mariniplasma anaerobium]BCR36035.1 hypothetical protein MPAN_009280 [Mariniplasma anaerobium]
MRKFYIMVFMFLNLLICTNVVYADSNYLAFESLNIASGKLLNDYTSKEYKTYYKNVDKRKFIGWRTYTVNKDIECSYITETLFSYYNNGYSAIEYEYNLDRKTTSKLSLSASGSIGIKTSSTKPTFKNNLDGSLKLSADYQISEEIEESYTVNLDVDAGTQVDLYIYGEGLITNGVAARYFFWVRVNRGGYEAFVVTTQYQRLEKTRI